MAAQKGREFLLKIGDGGGPETFTTLGGFQSNSFVINNELVDITNKDSLGKRELLPGAGIQSMTASGSGVFKDDAAFNTAHTQAQNQTLVNWQIVVPDFGTYEGSFYVESLEYGGEHNGEQTYNITLQSSGAVTFTPA